MICKICGSDFNPENFDFCPYCMTPVEKSSLKTEDGVEIIDAPREEEIFEEPVKIDHEEEDGRSCSIESLIGEEDYEVTEEDLFEESDEAEENSDVPIEALGLSVRATNAFRRARINTLNELIAFLASNSVSNLKSVGAKTVQETEELIKRLKESGIESVRKITEESSATETPLFCHISADVDYLSVDALTELGFSNKAVTNLMKSGIRCCGSLRYMTKKQLLSILGYGYADRLSETAQLLEKDIVELFDYVLEKQRGNREYLYFLRRAKGETLQEIADNPGIGETVTRERVRQVERSFLNSIVPFVREIFFILKGRNDYVTVNDLLDIYDDDDYDLIILYACKSFDEFEFLDFADMFVEKKELPSIERYLLKIVTEVVGDGIDLYENREMIEASLIENHVGFIDFDAVINLLKKYNYHLYGNFVVKGKANYSTICMQVVQKYFPNGIKLTQSEFESSEDLIRLRSIIDEKYPGMTMPSNDRALSSTLVRCGLILRGRGLYISQEHVILNESLFEDIKKYIDDRESNKVFYNEIYATFEGALNLLCGIDNYNYLHGALSLRYPETYEYSRDYLLKNGASEEETDGIADRIYSFICGTGRPISKSELFQKFRGFSNVMLMMPFVNDNRLLQWDYNCYTCVGILDCSEQDVVSLRSLINDLFVANNGYISDSLLLESVTEKYPEFITKNHIQSEMNLYYIVANLFSNEMDFKRPHIGVKGKIDISSTKNVALYLLGNPDFFDLDQYNDIADRMKWSRVTSGFVLIDIEEDYSRVSANRYIRKQLFTVPKEVTDAVRTKIGEEIEDGILPIMSIGIDELPDWDYQWNEFLIETVIRKCCGEYDIVNPSMKDRRYQRGIVVEKNKGLSSYPKVVATKMIASGNKVMTESQLLSFLIVNNLAKQVIPNELSTSEYVVKDGEYYKVLLQ